MSLWILGEFVFVVGILSFLLSYKHYLSMLLSLELVMLSLYVVYCGFVSEFCVSGEAILIYMTMMVCEGALGLGLLVYFARGFGCDVSYTFFLFS